MAAYFNHDEDPSLLAWAPYLQTAYESFSYRSIILPLCSHIHSLYQLIVKANRYGLFFLIKLKKKLVSRLFAVKKK